ncbi:hypothetical protein CIK76_05220 [Glutamicibacter sp. BW80]|nr:hypothetical protein CIK76_05220 [Glutamicibacter sp. BW80]
MLYGDALLDIASTITAAGIPATTEPAQLETPGALVAPGDLNFDHLDRDTYSATVELYLTTADRGSIETLNDLQELLEVIKGLYGFTTVTPVRLPAPNHSPDGLPALLIELAVTIS